MNTKINAELDRIYKRGFNPVVTEVIVNMDADKMKVKWRVKIEESKDGKAWVGFTSRGSSGDNSYYRATAKAVGQDPDTVKDKMMKLYEEPSIDFKKAHELLYNMTNTGKATGKCPTRQVFYIYTRPLKYPPIK